MTAAERAREFSESLKDQEWDEHVARVNGVNPVYKPKFEWPCFKRRPHAPHEIAEESHVHHPKDCPNCIQCPGLKAHPATQIGGGYAQEDIPA